MIMSKKEELTGKYFMANRSNFAEEVPTIEAAAAKLREEKEAEELKNLLFEAEKNKQKEINDRIEKLELVPMANKILIQPYPVNPYRKVVEGNIIVDYTGSFMNPDSGEEDNLKELIGCAKVVEVGPECKYVQNGDDIYYDTRTAYPLPFMSMGYKMLSESQVLCVLNEALKERFNM